MFRKTAMNLFKKVFVAIIMEVVSTLVHAALACLL